MCLPQVIKSFQNYRGVATTFYPTLVYSLRYICVPLSYQIWQDQIWPWYRKLRKLIRHLLIVLALNKMVFLTNVAFCTKVYFHTSRHDQQICRQERFLLKSAPVRHVYVIDGKNLSVWNYCGLQLSVPKSSCVTVPASLNGVRLYQNPILRVWKWRLRFLWGSMFP